MNRLRSLYARLRFFLYRMLVLGPGFLLGCATVTATPTLCSNAVHLTEAPYGIDALVCPGMEEALRMALYEAAKRNPADGYGTMRKRVVVGVGAVPAGLADEVERVMARRPK